MKKVGAAVAFLILTLGLFSSLATHAQGGGLDNAFGGYSETRKATEEAKTLKRMVKEQESLPIKDWPEKILFVFGTNGDKFIELYHPPTAPFTVTSTLKEKRGERRWSVQFSKGKDTVRTEGCEWKGDQAIGLLFIQVQGPRGGGFQQWSCLVRPLDQEFYDVAKRGGWDTSKLTIAPSEP